MIVEPVPASPRRRSRLGRLVPVLAVAVPPLALVAVVVAGTLGPKPEPARTAPSAAVASAVAAASPATAEAPASSASPSSADGVAAGGGIAGYPATIETLGTMTVEQLRAGRVEPGRIVAVRALLSMDAATGCGATPPALATFCDRTADLADRPLDFTASPANVGPHLRVAVPAGVRLPRQVLRDRDGERRLAPVVALVSARRDGGYRLERVAWVDGTRWRAPSIEPDTGRNPFDETWWQRRLDAEAALGLQARNGSVVMLVTAYTRADGLAVIAADAAAAVALRTTDPAHALWFVRALYPGGVGEGTPRRDELRWLVVDDWTGAVVARGTGRG